MGFAAAIEWTWIQIRMDMLIAMIPAPTIQQSIPQEYVAAVSVIKTLMGTTFQTVGITAQQIETKPTPLEIVDATSMT